MKLTISTPRLPDDDEDLVAILVQPHDVSDADFRAMAQTIATILCGPGDHYCIREREDAPDVIEGPFD
jgi:hypothetical protein